MIYRTLIVGLGKIGIGYDLNVVDLNIVNSHARAITIHEKFELVGGVDINHERRSIFNTFYKKNTYSTLIEAIDETSPDIVVVSSNSETHLETIEIICKSNHNIIAILCEKPLGTSLSDATNIVQLCHTNNIKLYVNFIRRSDIGAINILNRIIETKITLPVKGFCFYTKGFIHNASHFFNLLELWVGKMKDFTILSNESINNSGLKEPDVKIEFENGIIYFLAGNEEKFSYSLLEFVSDSGRLKYDFGGEKITWFSSLNISNNSEIEELIPNDLKKYQLNVFNEIQKSLTGEFANICTGDEALSNLYSMYKIIKLLN